MGLENSEGKCIIDILYLFNYKVGEEEKRE